MKKMLLVFGAILICVILLWLKTTNIPSLSFRVWRPCWCLMQISLEVKP
jgi:hypothetical protein